MIDLNEKVTHKIEAIVLDKRAKEKLDKEWKELFVKFIKENEIENLKSNTKDENVGTTLIRIKTKYKKETTKEHEKMREFYDCSPDGFLEKKR